MLNARRRSVEEEMEMTGTTGDKVKERRPAEDRSCRGRRVDLDGRQDNWPGEGEKKRKKKSAEEMKTEKARDEMADI